jgi:hypothetical protein
MRRMPRWNGPTKREWTPSQLRHLALLIRPLAQHCPRHPLRRTPVASRHISRRHCLCCGPTAQARPNTPLPQRQARLCLPTLPLPSLQPLVPQELASHLPLRACNAPFPRLLRRRRRTLYPPLTHLQPAPQSSETLLISLAPSATTWTPQWDIACSLSAETAFTDTAVAASPLSGRLTGPPARNAALPSLGGMTSLTHPRPPAHPLPSPQTTTHGLRGAASLKENRR